MQTITYSCPDISCDHCVHTINMELCEMEGIQSVEASAETRLVTVTFAPPANDEKIRALLAEINYPAI
ncbi:MAG: heavy-metal-associated domain-containing protein [Anaerolineae bacterium]|jgi:copper chaperone CopZ|nr:heavy-metal-associated domain-containing protein [Anaerolineae bacterium]